MVIDLGNEDQFVDCPAKLVLHGRTFFVIRTEAGYQLLSAVCPHQGGQVEDVGSCFECPQHGWRFERTSGQCLTSPSRRLDALPIVVRDTHLFVDLPAATAQTTRVAASIADLTVGLHAHACLELRYQGFSLLTDPWLTGPAFLGAWTQYPPPSVDITSLRPDAVLISHEHSDHFHEATLARFDRKTPVYFPDFPNRRIATRLTALGFTTLVPMRFGETYRIADGFQLTVFEPRSDWNDAIALIEAGEFRLLNINDAGMNQRIASLVGPVDALASSFSTGASGYPLTWAHIAEDDAMGILRRANQGILHMLREAATLYGARFVIPFASHFALWHPRHRRYMKIMPRNSVDDVVRHFEGTDVRVIDVLPGDNWDVETNRIDRRTNRDALSRDAVMEYVASQFDAQRDRFNRAYPPAGTLTAREVESYFLRLNDVPEIVFCEDLTLSVRPFDSSTESTLFSVSFGIANGAITVLTEPPAAPNIVISVPANILSLIVTTNASWDEALIGYWCRLTRSPDVYNAGFWRLLQAPYYRRRFRQAPPPTGVTLDTVVADLVETGGAEADRILRRYGLYCAGCAHAPHDTIRQAAHCHAIDQQRTERLVQELNQAFCRQPSGG